MPLIAAVLGAVAISLSAIFFELSGVSPTTGAFFRTLYALPILFLLWWRTRHRDTRSTRARSVALGAGVFLALDFITWHSAINLIGAGLATLISNAQVVIVALMAWLLLGETPSRRVLVAVPVVLGGVTLVSGLGNADAFGSDPLLGAVFALGTAVCYAFFLLGYRRSNQVQAPAVGSLLDATAGALLTTLLLSPMVGSIDLLPTWPSHGWILAISVISQVGGWLAIGYALPRLPAAETSTVILLQPVLTLVWAMILFAERPSGMQLAGAALVLGGVAMVAWTPRRRTQLRAAT